MAGKVKGIEGRGYKPIQANPPPSRIVRRIDTVMVEVGAHSVGVTGTVVPGSMLVGN